MIGVDMKGLIEKCNNFCSQALTMAAGMTINRAQYEVSFEHFLLACLEERNSDISIALAKAGGDIPRLKQALNRTLEDFRAGNSGRPVFSMLLQEALEAAWLVASVDLGITRIRSGAMLLAFLRRPSFFSQGGYVSQFSVINRDDLLNKFSDILATSVEDSGPVPGAGAGSEAAAGKEDFLSRFCEDFTAKAKDGKMDPVFGRDPEIRQMVDILARRRKNNPILVGEPGVGKTAVMEGLALRIIEGDVPDTLRGVRLLGLDMGLLEAGASVKGEFERRLKGVLDAVKGSQTPTILFIDEAHLLVGAGNASGGSDAANLMKPALARGEIRTCAATTWKEYKKYFEKDPALARRFQLVKLDEPSVETTALILRGLRSSYEKAHGVVVRDDAVQAAADYAGRYITGRFLPDKAVDLLDTACARIRVGLAAKPAPLEDAERAAQAGQRELNALERDAANGTPIAEERLTALRDAIAGHEAQAEELRVVWRKEKAAADAVIQARAALEEARKMTDAATREAEFPVAESAPCSETPADISAPSAADAAAPSSGDVVEASVEAAAAEEQPGEAAVPGEGSALDQARATLDAARAELCALQGDSPLIHVEVTPEAVGQVVSDWTGIPVGKLARDQAAMMADLGPVLEKRIIGQTEAIKAVVEGVQAGKAGLRAPEQPLGVFLLAGPSGVGKTETGIALADALFGSERHIVSVNMSEFQEKHTVSRLIGSPPGYVGYGEGGMLTEAVRRKPYSVVLLDEVEKAHPDVMQLFYQVFDKGSLTDGEGTEVSFSNTVIMLTSNLGSDVIQRLCADGAPDGDTLASAIRPLLSRHFQPALLARMKIVPYVSLQPDALARITGLKLNALASRLRANHAIRLDWNENAAQAIAMRCSETETGARNIDDILSMHILPQLSKAILLHMADGDMPESITLEGSEQGAISIGFSS